MELCNNLYMYHSVVYCQDSKKYSCKYKYENPIA